MGRRSSGFLWLIGGAAALGVFSSGEDRPERPAVEVAPTTEPARSDRPQPPANLIQPSQAERLFTTANLNLRSDASTSARVVTSIPKGATVTAEGKRGTWRNVIYRGQRGWVSSKFLSQGQPLLDRPKAIEKREPRPPAKVRSASNSGCDPNYTPCVPIASDVDCAGGSGNGPAYVQGPVRVIGRDIYGLDRNRDGVGCE